MKNARWQVSEKLIIKSTTMNSYNEFQAKPYFEYILKEYLYPLFQDKGYKRKGAYHWIKITQEIKVEIKLQKSAYSTKHGIIFWFWIAVQDIEGSLSVSGRQGGIDTFLPIERANYKRDNQHWNGEYLIYRASEFDKLLNEELKVDLEDYILPLLDKINTIEILSRIVSKEEEINKMSYGSRWYIPDEISFD